MSLHIKQYQALYNILEPNDEIYITVKRKNKIILRDFKTPFVKVDPSSARSMEKYLLELVHEFDQCLLSNNRGIEVLNAIARELTIKSAKNDKNGTNLINIERDGLFSVFLQHIKKLIINPYHSIISELVTKVVYLFNHIDNVVLQNQKTLQSIRERITTIGVNALKVFPDIKQDDRLVKTVGFNSNSKVFEYAESCEDADPQTRIIDICFQLENVHELIDGVVHKQFKECLLNDSCNCFLTTIRPPLIPRNSKATFDPIWDDHNLLNQSTIGIINHKCILGVIQFGCVTNLAIKRLYVYGHFDQTGKVLTNLTLILDRGITNVLYGWNLGIVALNLYKSKNYGSKEMIELTKGIPNVNWNRDEELRLELCQMIENKVVDNSFCHDICVRIANQFEGYLRLSRSNDWVECASYCQQTLLDLVTDVIYKGSDSSKLPSIPDEYKEVTCYNYFNNSFTQDVILPCLHKYTDRVINSTITPVLMLENGKYQALCGEIVPLGRLMFHPCFTPYLVIGRNLSIQFRARKCKNGFVAYENWSIVYGEKEFLTNKQSFCFKCAREYSTPLLSRLCEWRCHFIKKLALTTTNHTIFSLPNLKIFGPYKANEIDVEQDDLIQIENELLIGQPTYREYKLLNPPWYDDVDEDDDIPLKDIDTTMIEYVED